ncbi:MAG: uracil-DNA glycosylase [Bdellovibrionota bacterium]
MIQFKLSKGWLKFLKNELETEYMKELKSFLASQYETGKIIYPDKQNYFKALDLVEPEKVKVVILGQDPYHGENQAHGLSFSVPEGVKFPPSLQNIFKELKSDLNIDTPVSGDLTSWAEQGVLLLNSVLSVEKDKAASHQKLGWEKFTDKVISVINENCEHVVFILWGSYALKKAELVDRKKHLILKSVHPSPLSSYRGFFDSKPFSKANTWLKEKGKKEIKW